DRTFPAVEAQLRFGRLRAVAPYALRCEQRLNVPLEIDRWALRKLCAVRPVSKCGRSNGQDTEGTQSEPDVSYDGSRDRAPSSSWERHQIVLGVTECRTYATCPRSKPIIRRRTGDVEFIVPVYATFFA